MVRSTRNVKKSAPRTGSGDNFRPIIATHPSSAFYCDFYNRIGEYEHHFDSMEFEVRKIASVWMLAIFSAFAFVVRGELHADAGLVSSPAMLCLIALFGNVGILSLWCLEQKVYHNLLNAAFLIGLNLERRFPEIPPIRSQMWKNSESGGMARYQALFYALPMAVAGLAGLVGATRVAYDFRTNAILVLAALAATMIPLWVARTLVTDLLGIRGFRTETELGDEARISADAEAVLERWRSALPKTESLSV